MNNWKAGMRAVRINATRANMWTGYEPAPIYGAVVEGVVYIVEDVELNFMGPGSPKVCLRFPDWPDLAWEACDFRPVVPLCDQADTGQEIIADPYELTVPSPPRRR